VRSLHNRLAKFDMCYFLIAEKYPIKSSIENQEHDEFNRYSVKGYRTHPIQEHLIEPLMEYFDPSLVTPFEQDDYQPNYYSPTHSQITIARINDGQTYFTNPKAGRGTRALLALLTEMTPLIEQCIGHAFEVVNVRAWVTHVHAEPFGPNGWHVDGISHFVRKVMVYPRPLGPKTGSFEIRTADGEKVLMDSAVPLAVLADVGDLQHRGIPPNTTDPQLGGRPAIEVTLIPAPITRLNVDFHGHNAHVPEVGTHQFRQLLERNNGRPITLINQSPLEKKINIGGGLSFAHEGWINFDAASPNYKHRLNFNADTKLPYPSGQANLVYSSHCLEHLDDPTVIQMLSEAQRILSDCGDLVIKLPDFDAVLADWRRRDSTGILAPAQWGVIRLFKLWQQHGVSTGIEAWTAMIFSGFWNSAYGNPFLGTGVCQEGAYHGPPRLSSQRLSEILDSELSPHLISSILKSQIVRHETDFTFNHQNAWSRAEFIALARCVGFELVATDGEVGKNFQSIPTLDEMGSMSAYYHFRKITSAGNCYSPR